jgi:type I restriction enzyme S subunit
MKLETFFQKFDELADAPDAIPAMRELMLQLAVRGNLTERIGGESSKAQIALADAFRVRRGKREKPDAEDIPFPIPENWGWVAVGDSMDMFNGRAFKPEEWSTEGTPIIRIQNLNNEHAAFNRCKTDLDPKIHVHDGDFLISWSGTPGTSFGAFIWNRGFAYLNQHIFRCELVKGVFEKEFLRLAINARLDEMISHAQGAVGLRHITKGKLESIRLPLPPLAEQKRIVAKVDELMALCDRLEEQQQERETRRAALARASLARFADAPQPSTLNSLFHPSYAIPPADLRKSILTLAVQGKLVPQDPNDEPAEDLLARLASELTPEQRRNQAAPLAPLPEEALQYELPTSWKWARFRDAAIIASNLVKPDGFLDFTHLAPDNIEKGNGVLLPCRTVREDKVISSNHRFYPGQIVYSKIRPNLAKVVIVDFEGLCSADMYPIDALIDAFYLQRYMLSESFLVQAVKTDTRVAMPKINQMELNAIAVPIPPLAEQRRIVAKVEQLMALVDALETQLAASRATAANLLSALVAELTTGA